jgi:hypothetical protein
MVSYMHGFAGLIDTIPGKEPMYVFNGFFMSMRSDFVKPGNKIHYYVVEWSSLLLPFFEYFFTSSYLLPVYV